MGCTWRHPQSQLNLSLILDFNSDSRTGTPQRAGPSYAESVPTGVVPRPMHKSELMRRGACILRAQAIAVWATVVTIDTSEPVDSVPIATEMIATSHMLEERSQTGARQTQMKFSDLW
jgi:hypothetical protein